eukprot:1920494-Rhodomonas_salina.3
MVKPSVVWLSKRWFLGAGLRVGTGAASGTGEAATEVGTTAGGGWAIMPAAGTGACLSCTEMGPSSIVPARVQHDELAKCREAFNQSVYVADMDGSGTIEQWELCKTLLLLTPACSAMTGANTEYDASSLTQGMQTLSQPGLVCSSAEYHS